MKKIITALALLVPSLSGAAVHIMQGDNASLRSVTESSVTVSSITAVASSPEVIFVESDQSSPGGKYRILVDNDILYIMARNASDTGNIPIASFTRYDSSYGPTFTLTSSGTARMPLRFGAQAGNYISFKASQTANSNTYVLMADSGTPGQAILTDGSNNLYFGQASGSSVYNSTATAGFPFGSSFSTVTVTGVGSGVHPILQVLNPTFDNTSVNDTPTLLVQGDWDNTLVSPAGPIVRIDNTGSGGGAPISILSFSDQNVDKSLILWSSGDTGTGGSDGLGQICIQNGATTHTGTCFGGGTLGSGHNKPHVVIGGGVVSGGPALDIIADIVQSSPSLKVRGDTLGTNITEWWNNGATVLLSSVSATGVFTASDFNAKYGVSAATISAFGSGAGELDMLQGVQPSAIASNQVLWADSQDSWLKFIPNATTDYLVVGSSASVTADHCAKFSANGSIVDAGVCGASGSSGSGVYSATATAAFPFGMSVSTVVATGAGGLRIANNDGQLDFYNTANNSSQAFIESVNASSLKIYQGGAYPMDLYTNDAVRLRVGGAGSVAMSSNTIMPGATFYYSAPIRMGGHMTTASLYINGGNATATGASNLMIGISGGNPGSNLTNGNSNTCIGSLACPSVTTDASMTAVGTNAANASSGSTNNSAFGSGSLFSNTTGGSNTAIGKNALLRVVTGSRNTAIGDSACDNNSRVSSTTANGQICIGAGSWADASNVMAIGGVGTGGSSAGLISDVYMNSRARLTDAIGSSVTFHAQASSGTNRAGGNFSISSGEGTGTGTRSSVFINTSIPGTTSGTLETTLSTVGTFAYPGLGLMSQTAAQIAAITPFQAGQMIYCSDCTALRVCISTGTAQGAWSSPVAATTACN